MYRFGADGVHITAKELEKLDAISPGKKWVPVVCISIAAL